MNLHPARLAVLSVALVAALAACKPSGDAATAPADAGTAAAPASPQAATATLSGAGSSFIYPLVSKWSADYNAASGARINYQSIGSGGGIAQIKAGTVDFGCTDKPLSPDELAQVQGIFVSVDPERDTMEILNVYAPFFHPRIVGASGTPAQVAEVARRYGVSYMKQKSVDDRPYTVDHSSSTYLVDRQGRIAAILPHGAPVTDIVSKIRSHLQKKENTR